MNQIKTTDRIIEKTILPFIPRSITPNQITIIRFLLTPVVAWLLIKENYEWGLTIFTIAALTDAIDGAMARTRDQITNTGKIIDPAADRLLVASVIIFLLPKFFNYYFLAFWVLLELFQAGVAMVIQKRAKIQLEANGAGKLKMILQSAAIISLFIFILSGAGLFFGVAKFGFYSSMAPLIAQPFFYGNQTKVPGQFIE